MGDVEEVADEIGDRVGVELDGPEELRTIGGHQVAEQALFVAEVRVEAFFTGAGGAGDAVDPGSGKAVLGKFGACCGENLLAELGRRSHRRIITNELVRLLGLVEQRRTDKGERPMRAADVLDPTIATMPRGGPDASWLDRRFQTEALEYLDREDVSDEVKQRVITMLDRVGTLAKHHEKYARAALKAVSDIPNPRILELGAGHGKLSAKILELHPSATVTVSDLDPTSVDNIAAGKLGTHPRARAQVIDATAIDAADNSYDLVVFALSFHHLPPAVASRAIAEATRVGKRFLVIDLKRQAPLKFALSSALLMPAHLLLMPFASARPALHDGFISMLRAYSSAAFKALGRVADPGMQVDILPPPSRLGPPMTAVMFSRPSGH